MSEQDIDRLVLAVRDANRPMGNKVLLGSAGVIIAVITACIYIGGALRDVENLKDWKSKAEPQVVENTKDIAVINQILKIK